MKPPYTMQASQRPSPAPGELSQSTSSPSLGRVVPELARFGMRTWRELVVRPYRLVYRIEADTVTPLAVFDGRRDLEDVLLDRLLRMP